MPDSAQSSHPGLPQLAAYAQGKLPDAERAALQAHLAECPACCKALVALPGGAESLSGRDTLLPAGGGPPLPETTDYRTASDVPADLANHPKFEVLKLLGKGGMGAVYKVRHKIMNRIVALKVINAQLVGNDKFVERFHREVQAAAKLDHANIVRAFDADQAGTTHFLVMEYVEGTDLAKYVEKKGPLPVVHACHFTRQAALGLQHANERGMVHRDIKPHNLLLTAQGVVKVTDFGLARLGREGASAAGLTGENALMGTADYIAPEQVQDAHRADIRADIYSLGCSLFHLLAGKAPFASGTAMQKIAAHLMTAVPLAELPAATPESLRIAMAKMVEKDPAKRYQTPTEVALALLPFVKKQTTQGPETTGEPAPMKESLEQSATVARAATARESLLAANTQDPEPSARQSSAKKSRQRQRSLGPVIATALLALAFVLWVSVPVQHWLRTRPSTTPPDKDEPKTLTVVLGGGVKLEMVRIPAGRFMMGSPKNEEEREANEVLHEVIISQPFYLGKYEVTQEQYEAVTGKNPSSFSPNGDSKEKVAGGKEKVAGKDSRRFPVENVSWDDAVAFCRKLNEQQPQKGWRFDLPTEAQWEFAGRAGTTTPFHFGNKCNGREANCDGTNPYGTSAKGPYLERTCLVGSYEPNAWGLYDMHGNVWEWCKDRYGPYSTDKQTEPEGPNDGSRRVGRGGSWDYTARYCRSAYRGRFGPASRYLNLGFRLAQVPSGSK